MSSRSLAENAPLSRPSRIASSLYSLISEARSRAKRRASSRLSRESGGGASGPPSSRGTGAEASAGRSAGEGTSLRFTRRSTTRPARNVRSAIASGSSFDRSPGAANRRKSARRRLAPGFRRKGLFRILGQARKKLLPAAVGVEPQPFELGADRRQPLSEGRGRAFFAIGHPAIMNGFDAARELREARAGRRRSLEAQWTLRGPRSDPC